MTTRYANVTINLDRRQKDGSPEVVKWPKDGFRWKPGEVVFLTVSVVEKGCENELLTATASTPEAK